MTFCVIEFASIKSKVTMSDKGKGKVIPLTGPVCPRGWVEV